MGHGGLAGPPARAPEKMRHDAFSSVDLLAYLVIFSRRGERMYDSDTGTIMAKVHEYKRKAHDCATRRTPSQLALLLKAVHLLAARCRDLVAEARNLEREANGLLLKLTAPLASRGAPIRAPADHHAHR